MAPTYFWIERPRMKSRMVFPVARDRPEYYDRQGNPLTLLEWVTMLERRDPSYQRVARTVTENGYLVSTVWLGMDHSFGSGPPVIFETMVFRCDAAGDPDMRELACDRYSTEAEAQEGHDRFVAEYAAKPSARRVITREAFDAACAAEGIAATDEGYALATATATRLSAGREDELSD